MIISFSLVVVVKEVSFAYAKIIFLNSYLVETRSIFDVIESSFRLLFHLIDECVRHTTMMVVGLLGNCFIQLEIFVYIALFFLFRTPS